VVWAVALLAFGALIPGHQCSAQAPAKVVRIILPATVGSPPDVAARILAQRLQTFSGESVIVESRPGAGSAIGSRAVIAAPPNGSTLLFGTVSHVLAPIFIQNLGYDPIKDFVSVAQVAQGSWVLVMNPRVPANSLPELVAYSKANPGKLNIATLPANALQLVGDAFRQQTGADVTDVNYQGLSQGMTNLLSGEVHLAFNTPATLLPLIQSGQLRALAVTGRARDPTLPHVPTMAEVGYPGVTLGYWLGVLARAGTPPDVVAKLNADIGTALASSEVEKTMAGLGFERKIGSPDDFAAVLKNDLALWTGIAAAGGIKPN